MQSVGWLIFVLALLVLVVNGESVKSNVLSISSGTSFGECIGYCRKSITVTSTPSQVSISKKANFNQASYPPVYATVPLTSSELVSLVNLVNIEIFQSLDDRIGCPDCADGGAEWVQIIWANGSKRVTFENGKTVKGIEELIAKLRQMRQAYLSEM
ncbi:unnamed protein product [Rotaria sordida]|uniref:Uncharacterized protein n=1 Tax=Rotaria sordida TaxID=392033 RepID=A0A814Q7P4_9BILA|nr:unnamed protein product [Rotaria sordida]CAF1115881.1 unnamed protein product [Rotaria sordida]CAF3762432.1 unnamed protein product [Rotaria sordida]CAF3921484.1 unnamed protein product [Rotaria sordida]